MNAARMLRGAVPFVIAVGIWLVPLRWLGRWLQRLPRYWKLARAYYFVDRKPAAPAA